MRHGVIFYVFFTLAISSLSGFATALATIAWIAPSVQSDISLRSREPLRQAMDASIDPRVGSEIRQRVIAIYDTSKTINGAYPKEALVGYAALLTSDGWAVASVPSYRPFLEKNLKGIDHQGILHSVEKVYNDSIGHSLYIKFAGDGFRVVSFVRENAVQFGAQFFALDGDVWRRFAVDTPARFTSGKSFALSRPEYFFRIRGDLSAGDLLWSDRGEFVGIADDRHFLISSAIIDKQIPHILSEGSARYTNFGLDGFLVSAIVSASSSASEPGAVRMETGFYLTKAPGLRTRELMKGDIIVAINNQNITLESLSQMTFLTGDRISLIVNRGGQEKEVVISAR